MAAEGTINLRPRTMGELLDQAIRLYRKNFLTFIGIIALMQVPLTLIQLGIQYYQANFGGGTLSTSSDIGSSFSNLLLSIAQFILIGGVATAALTRAIGDSFLGEKIGILDAYKRIGNSWSPLLGALFGYGLLMIPVFIWIFVPLIGWLTGPGILVFLITIVGPFIALTVVLERRRGGKAILRSWNLGMARFWWLLGFTLILGLFSYIIISGPVALLQVFFLSQLGSIDPGDFERVFTIQLILQTLLGLVLGLLYTPLRSVGYILAYFDLRVRFEGFDIAILARQTEGIIEAVGDLSTVGIAPPEKLKLGWTQIGYFVGLSVVLIAIFLVLAFVLFGSLSFISNL